MSYILLIDDDKWYSQSISNMFKKQKVLVANSPEQAMTIIDTNIPYMIYLNLNLGSKNGITILNELQSWTDTRKVPIVLLSADGKRLNIADWEKYGVVEILDKTQLTPNSLNKSLIKGKLNVKY